MDKKRLTGSSTFVYCSNLLFLMSGFAIMFLGVLLLLDNERVLLSRLVGFNDVHTDQPPAYYLSFAMVGMGFVIALTGLLATCFTSSCVTTWYVMSLTLLLLGEFACCVIAVFWPHLLGIEIRSSRLVRALQRNYALPGREQFTAALDLAQTAFSCCGINGSSNYGTSWWRLQEVGRRELVVPLTCCTLNNTQSPDAFLNPQPEDLQLCQTLNPLEHQRARHTTGCLDMIEKWTQDQALIFLVMGLIVMLIEISALVSTILAWSKSNPKRKTNLSTFTSTQTLTHSPTFTIESNHNVGLGMENSRSHTDGSTFCELKSHRKLRSYQRIRQTDV
ncbi:tetraspanin-11-like [Diachasma alloeum]|uniref:tetraspanin-11-like n=1 Tax=Diachasma alloeum TaxID=454923 RepID=UPI0007381FB5|nr:tetraspanin-11-like [Diachasma alloeum]